MNDKASSDSYRWIVLGVIILGTFTSILTSSMVNVAMPRIMTTFGINREQVEWISTSFMLASAVAMPMVGWMVGRFGHKAFYLGSLAVFTVGTAACSLAWNYNTLIAARVVQAVGGGAMQPAGMAMVATLFAPEERGRAMGVWADRGHGGTGTGSDCGWVHDRMVRLAVGFHHESALCACDLTFRGGHYERRSIDTPNSEPF